MKVLESALANAGRVDLRLTRHASSRGVNSTSLFAVSLIKIRMKLYDGPRVRWTKAGEI